MFTTLPYESFQFRGLQVEIVISPSRVGLGHTRATGVATAVAMEKVAMETVVRRMLVGLMQTFEMASHRFHLRETEREYRGQELDKQVDERREE